MRGEPGDRLSGLGLDLGGEPVLLRVGGAGEQEVLPDQHAEFVAAGVELLGLVDPAAPDPQQVHVGIDGVGDPPRVAVGVDLGQERVVGNPVGTADLDRFAVHPNLEGVPASSGSTSRLDGAESDPTGPGGGGRAAPARAIGRHRGSADGDVVQRLLAVPDRPPPLDGGDPHSQRRGVRAGDDRGFDCGAATGPADARPDLHVGRRRDRVLQFDVRDEKTGVTVDADQRPDRSHANAGPALDADRSARCRRWRRPCPSPSRSCKPSCASR